MPAGERVESLAQGDVDRRILYGLQGVTSHVGEFLVRKKNGECRDSLGGADSGEPKTGVGLCLQLGSGREYRDQRGFLFCSRGGLLCVCGQRTCEQEDGLE